MAHLHILNQKLDVLAVQTINVSYFVTGMYFYKHVTYFTLLSFLRKGLRIIKYWLLSLGLHINNLLSEKYRFILKITEWY